MFWIVGLLPLVFIAIAVAVFLSDRRRKLKRRRDSLHRGDDGDWIWVDLDGHERRSRTHPEAETGAWTVQRQDSGTKGGRTTGCSDRDSGPTDSNDSGSDDGGDD